MMHWNQQRSYMLKDDVIRLRHMLDAALEAESFIEDKDRVDLDNGRKLELAIVNYQSASPRSMIKFEC